jgi:16S rRNA (guanine966-N2)-methyltransferase
MRVTGGILRGRILKVPRGDAVRPTQDMVRQALFSSLAARIPGCRFLDLFAGSGAVGLEAWSRGAGQVVWVEGDGRAFRVLQGNIQTLCGSETGKTEDQEWRAVRSDAFHYLRGLRGMESYDIVFADPPYDRTGVERWSYRLLDELSTGQILAADGFFVMEQAREETEATHPAWDVVTTKEYGGTRLTLYRRRQHEAFGDISRIV